MILKAGRHLLALLDDVLDISRIEGGHLAMSVEPVPVAALIDDVLDLARPLAEADGVYLSAPPTLPADLCVAADRQRLRQVLLNLLSNAIKYNHPTGTVSVTVEHRADRRLRISVTDTGRGIPPEALGKLFTPFERLDAAQAGLRRHRTRPGPVPPAGRRTWAAPSMCPACPARAARSGSTCPPPNRPWPTDQRPRPMTWSPGAPTRSGKRVLYVEDMVGKRAAGRADPHPPSRHQPHPGHARRDRPSTSPANTVPT